MNSVVSALEVILADTYALYLKTQNYHWNVEGQDFKPLHEMFEKQYDDLFEAIDVVGELIRGLGSRTIGTFGDFSRLTNIKDGNKDASATQMVSDLLHDHELMGQTLGKALKVAQEAGDEVVASYLGSRMMVHRKTSWMLRSTSAK
ncbi:MAG: DNA starvation/stationary phase protection protein [Puniceicoccales bacterium]|jgi:starvation-inducible DNA-binding protein|nr:DNA starvation/stationary phase protection protein [Puniceicoccales bacterium]